MTSGFLAFALACSFLGAALYINLVEQPARLALSAQAMVKEWTPSNRRGFVLLSLIAIVSAILAYAAYSPSGDVRFLIGGSVMLSVWLYAYFVVVPVNVSLAALPPGRGGSTTRELMREYGLVEWGQTLIALAACTCLGWALLQPA